MTTLEGILRLIRALNPFEHPRPERAIIVRRHEDPRELKERGFIISGSWGLSSMDARSRRKRGLRVPARISGHLLIDTGASHSAISDEAASSLGIIPHGQVEIHGPNGSFDVLAMLASLGVTLQNGEPKHIDLYVTDMGNIRLECVIGSSLVDGRPITPVGIIGRDFLSRCRMIYDGASGVVELGAYEPIVVDYPAE
jgi:hypothetical protein